MTVSVLYIPNKKWYVLIAKKGRQKNQFILKCSVLYDISNERVLNENVFLDNSFRWKRSFDRAGLMFSNIFQLIKVST